MKMVCIQRFRLDVGLLVRLSPDLNVTQFLCEGLGDMTSGKCLRILRSAWPTVDAVLASLQSFLKCFSLLLRDGGLWTPVRCLSCLRSTRKCGFSGRPLQENVKTQQYWFDSRYLFASV